MFSSEGTDIACDEIMSMSAWLMALPIQRLRHDLAFVMRQSCDLPFTADDAAADPYIRSVLRPTAILLEHLRRRFITMDERVLHQCLLQNQE